MWEYTNKFIKNQIKVKNHGWAGQAGMKLSGLPLVSLPASWSGTWHSLGGSRRVLSAQVSGSLPPTRKTRAVLLTSDCGLGEGVGQRADERSVFQINFKIILKISSFWFQKYEILANWSLIFSSKINIFQFHFSMNFLKCCFILTADSTNVKQILLNLENS